MVQIGGAANREFTATLGSIIRAEEIPGITILDDGRIVGVLDITHKLND
jgi:hypothetical protein